MASAFDSKRFEPVDHFQNFAKGKLHYVTVGNSNLPALLMIHGSPGSWDNFLDMMTKTPLLDSFYVIAVDRPGYNQTTLPAGFSLQEQARFLKPLVNEYFKKPGIILGHSYGGALAMQAGIDYQPSIKSLVIVAGTVANPYQDPRWYNYVAKNPPVKWMIGDDLKTSNAEMMALETDLSILDQSLDQFRKPVAIIQGSEDILVDDKSADYLEKKLAQAPTKLFFREGMNHFVIWSDKDLVMEALRWANSQQSSNSTEQ